jgi:adenylate cyclase
MSLFTELRRRNVFRFATAYVVSAWLIVQVVETLFPIFGLSAAAIRLVVILLAIGFVPAVIGAWVFQLTPEGVKVDPGSGESAPGASRMLDRVIIVVLVLGISYFAVDKFVLAPERVAEREAQIAEEAADEARKGFYGDRSIAVLPFDILSSDPEQVHFADGIAEEVLNLLARIRELRVISRSSACPRSRRFSTSDMSSRVPCAKMAIVCALLHSS